MARRHLFVCTNPRSSGRPACGASGEALIALVQRQLIERGSTEALVTPTGCLGPCFDGPTAVVYPDGTWYGALAPEDAAGLVDHLVEGHPHLPRVAPAPGIDNT